MMTSNNYLILHRLLRRLQQKNRFIGSVTTTGLSPVETHVLIEIEANPAMNISQLATLLRIDQSFASRVVQKFVKSNLIETKVKPDDTRQKSLSLTTQGLALTKQIDSAADSIIATFNSRLSRTQQGHVVRLFRLLSDYNNLPPGVQRSHESPYRVEQRRVSRLFGLLGTNVWQSGLSGSEWHTLVEICNAHFAPQVSELATLLGLQVNSVSTILNSLEERGFIRREESKSDGRAFTLAPQKKGIAFSREVETNAAKELEESLKPVHRDFIDNLLPALQLFVGESGGCNPPLLPGYDTKEICTVSEMAQARGLTARCFVKHNLEHTLPTVFFPASLKSFVVLQEQEPVGTIQIHSHGKTAKIELACSLPSIPAWTFSGIIAAAVVKVIGPQRSFELKGLLSDAVTTL